MRAGRRLTQRHHARLLPQRRVRIDQPAAIEPRLAPNALRAVELIEPALVIEQGDDAEPLLEQVPPRRVDHFPARVRVAHELCGIGYRNLARADDAVSIRVLERIGPLPPAVDRVARDLARCGANDRRDAAHVGDEVRVVGGADAQVPADVRLVQHARIGQDLDAAIHDRTQVLEP